MLKILNFHFFVKQRFYFFESIFIFGICILSIRLEGEEVAKMKILVVDSCGECCGGINFEEVQILGATYTYDEHADLYRIHIE